MKKLTLFVFLLSIAAFSFASPKREFRAVWISPVSGDWPTSPITIPGNTAQINQQKKQLTTYLDKVKAGNLNAVFLHVRAMADAFYPTTLTTWSAYICARGVDPGYDPLAFAIEECHKRGLELHAWLNPFRYESSTVTHPTDDYMRVQHPDWILGIGSESILNPGLPAVRTHIANVTKEIITNYPDIDGIVWDDYFYISGISSQDNATFKAYNPNNLSLADWRRDNVNQAVAETYAMIQGINPGIRFGIAPPGIWSTSSTAAAKYGVSLPDNVTGCWDVYNSIYADGLAWLKANTIDYISPQVYWRTDNPKPDYISLTTWWSQMAKKFGRHMYTSQGLYDMSTSYPFTREDCWLQIDKNRALDGTAPGSVFFCLKNYLNEYMNTYLPANRFQQTSLTPVISFKNSENLGVASNVVRSGNTLSWTAPANGRKFAIYHLPAGMENNMRNYNTATYLIGTAFGTSMDVSDYADNFGTHRFAVRTLDRMGNESSPVVEIVSAVENTTMDGNPVMINTKNGVAFELLQPSIVAVYTTAGQLISSNSYDGLVEILLERGCYVIQIDAVLYKIVH
jgi:uncharacterized lipoprotein YddW (UPF0748 family)